MKKDQYIPHEVSMRNTTEVMNLIENEGMAGYGIYWAIMEYLRTQDDYVGDVRVLKSLARQLKTKIGKITSVLTDYGLFVVTDFTFRSAKLEAMMKPLEDKRKAILKKNASQLEAEYKQSASNVETECKQTAFNSLEINDSSSLSKVKESKVKKSKVSSSKDDVAVAPVSLAWERYVDELVNEQQWIEIMAMRNGLGKTFVQRFGCFFQQGRFRYCHRTRPHAGINPGVASFQYNTHNGRFVPMEESKTPDLPNQDPVWDNSNWLGKKKLKQGEIFS